MLITCAYKPITRVVAQREFPGSYSPKVTVYYFRSNSDIAQLERWAVSNILVYWEHCLSPRDDKLLKLHHGLGDGRVLQSVDHAVTIGSLRRQVLLGVVFNIIRKPTTGMLIQFVIVP